MLPLKDVKILDLTRVLSGPFSTMILADFGADVLKVEMPKTGDDSRGFGPYVNGESAYYMSINRNKKSMTLNLKDAEAKEILKQLIMESDVVVENFKTGTMEKLGFGYEDIIKYKPDIIYAACTGFGQTGPYAKRPAYDAIVQGMGGVMSITGKCEGDYTRVGSSIGDITAGIYTTVGIMIALYHKEKTGEGQKIDVSMLDCQVSILENAISRYLVSGEIPQPKGNRHASLTPFEPFDTKDNLQVMIAIGNEKMWQRFCNLCNREDLITNELFASNYIRTQNYDKVRPVIAEMMKTHTAAEWLQLLEENNIPATEINTIDKVINNPQVIARDMIKEVDHPIAGKFKMPGIPIKMSKTPGEIRTAAPVLGSNTEEILKDRLNLDSEKINKLKEEGSI